MSPGLFKIGFFTAFSAVTYPQYASVLKEVFMATAKKSAKGYSVSCKKKTATVDPYIPKAGRPVSVCRSCKAVYMNKRWYADDGILKNAAGKDNILYTTCPACQKINERFPGGVLTLKGVMDMPNRDDLMNLIKNEEEKARGLNPLERIMSVEENGSGNIVISTTNEKLAQRLGRAVKKAFHGEITYKWSHDNKLVRVDWTREAV